MGVLCLFLVLRRAFASAVRGSAGSILVYASAGTILSVLLAACAGPLPLAAGSPTSQGCGLLTETQQAAAAFRRLRTEPGHFEGGPWIADVDTWMGPLHRSMIALGSDLGGSGCGQVQVTDLLGPPDRIANPGDPEFDQVRRQADFVKPAVESYTLLIYYWRGAHDFLYFTSDGEAILGSGWWYSYE